jgi:hypothetical protein
MAQYGKSVGATSLEISRKSTVAPRMIANTAEKMARYKYSWAKNDLAPYFN